MAISAVKGNCLCAKPVVGWYLSLSGLKVGFYRFRFFNNNVLTYLRVTISTPLQSHFQTHPLMKTIFTTLAVCLVIASCNSVKHIYTDDNINERQLEKLVKNYVKEPTDTGNANKLQYAYNFILNGHLTYINQLKQNASLNAKEQLIGAYASLQEFYNNANAIPMVSQLVRPGNVQAEKQMAVANAAAAWYQHGEDLLSRNSWQAGRDAYNVFAKVNGWIPNYEASVSRMQEAREMGIIHAVLQPLRTEGFYQQTSYRNNNQGFANQLLSDLSNAWNSNDLYRVYDANEAYHNQVQPDWIIEPVLTRLEVSPLKYTRSSRIVTKKIEIGKDSVKNPIYKTIKAELSITEAKVYAVGDMEARITDAISQQKVDRRGFSESFVVSEVTATYKGDKDALSKADWVMINNRNIVDVDERWMKEKVLEKIYPDMLGYLKNSLH
jgi:hypothetical protein